MGAFDSYAKNFPTGEASSDFATRFHESKMGAYGQWNWAKDGYATDTALFEKGKFDTLPVMTDPNENV